MQSALPQQLVAQTPNTVIGGIAATPRSTLADGLVKVIRETLEHFVKFILSRTIYGSFPKCKKNLQEV